MSAWMLPLLILLPLLSAALVGYFRNTWSKTGISWVATGSIFICFLCTASLLFTYLSGTEPLRAALTNWGPLGRLGLLADGLSLWWMLVVTGCGFLIHLYSTGYMIADSSYGRFMAELNYFIFAMSLLVLSDNFAGLLVGWANVGLASYMLIGFYQTKPSASAAAMKAFVMNIIGEVGLVAGIAFIYAAFHTLNYDAIFVAVQTPEAQSTLNLIGGLLLIGALAKSAQLPLHTWLPNAMEGPTPVSALIHAATMVTAGVYLVSRAWPIYQAAGSAAAWVAWLGALGAFYGALVASGQNDIKRVLAFSTLSQIGYMFLGNGLGAYVAADFHFFTHAFFKAALFLCAGIVVHHYHGDQDIRKMGGLMKRDRFAFWTFLIGLLALIGIPPFAGFFSKDEILLAAYHKNMVLFVVGVLAAGLTAFYNVRLFSLVFLGEQWAPPGKAPHKRRAAAQAGAHQQHEADHATPISMRLAVGVLAALSVVGGLIFFPHWPVRMLRPSFAGLEVEAEPINLVVASIVTVTALVGAWLSWYLYGPKGVARESARSLQMKGGIRLRMFYVDEIYDFLVVGPTNAIADFCAIVGDGRLIDGFVNGLASLTTALGDGLRKLQNGEIGRYALYLFAGVAAMLLYYIAYA